MRVSGGVLLITVISVLAAGAVPAAAAALEQGTVEVGLDGAFVHQAYSYEGESVGSRTDASVALGVGYCLTDLLELKLSLLFAYLSLDPERYPSSSASSYGATGTVVLNFATAGRLVPFVQGGVGVLAYGGDGYEDASTTAVLPTVSAGVRYLVGDAASLNCCVFYRHLLNAEGVEDISANQMGVSAGVSLLF